MSNSSTAKKSPVASKSNSPVVLGTGILLWHNTDPGKDRYPSVRVAPSVTSEVSMPIDATYEGQCGTLIARLLQRRTFDELGPHFQKLIPPSPPVDAEFELGYGVLYFEEQYGVQSVGIRRDDGHIPDWFSPSGFYACHRLKVDLMFVPDEDIAAARRQIDDFSVN